MYGLGFGVRSCYNSLSHMYISVKNAWTHLPWKFHMENGTAAQSREGTCVHGSSLDR